MVYIYPCSMGIHTKKNCLLRLNDALAEKKLISLNNDKKLIALRSEPDGLRFVVHRVDDGYRL